MSAITFGTTIAQSVVEEKQTRVVEILMSAIPVRALLAGKVVGNSLLAFAQITAIALLAASRPGDHRPALAAVGSRTVADLVRGLLRVRVRDARRAVRGHRRRWSRVRRTSAASPRRVMVLIMLPYILVILFNDNPLVLGIMSYVPFSAPVGMPMRIFLGTAAWWEPLASLALLLLTTVVVIVLGSRIYSNSLLRTGSRVKLREALTR